MCIIINVRYIHRASAMVFRRGQSICLVFRVSSSVCLFAAVDGFPRRVAATKERERERTRDKCGYSATTKTIPRRTTWIRNYRLKSGFSVIPPSSVSLSLSLLWQPSRLSITIIIILQRSWRLFKWNLVDCLFKYVQFDKRENSLRLNS